jgi:hypothetical protein
MQGMQQSLQQSLQQEMQQTIAAQPKRPSRWSFKRGADGRVAEAEAIE